MREGNERSVIEQSVDLLEYLSAVAREIGPKPVRDVRSQPFTLWPSEIPALPQIKLGPGPDRPSWLTVPRVPAPAPATVPADLRELLDNPRSLEDPAVLPELSQDALARRIDTGVAHQWGAAADAAREELRSELETAFRNWVDTTWSAWAERATPIVAARKLYSRLYELHLTADLESATVEVIWGHLLLTSQTSTGVVLAPLLTTRVDVLVDPDDATIRVLTEQPVELELDAVEGTDLAGLDGLVALKSTLRTTPPDPWQVDERQAVRRQLIAPLGLDASLHNSGDPAPVTTAPLVNDGWVLFLRRRPLKQERFYDELAKKIRNEQFLPESLASVAADKERVDAALIELGREVVSDDGSADRLMMPLPANAEQERIARQLARARGVTVQGPPGTGKSHTIVNLVSHLVAQGKRVLVTAEKEQALSVLRDKIPEEIRDLSLAVLGSTPAAMEELRSAAQAMQDSLSAIDTPHEQRRIAELGARVDALRHELAALDHALVEALQSEEREYLLPSGPMRAAQLASALSTDTHLDLVEDRVPTNAPVPLTPDELADLVRILRTIPPADAEATQQQLPVDRWLPSAAQLSHLLSQRKYLSAKVTELSQRGVRPEGLDHLSPEGLLDLTSDLRTASATLTELGGEWEDRLADASRRGDTSMMWIVDHNRSVRTKLAEARSRANELAGHVVEIPDGDPAAQLSHIAAWSQRVAAGKNISFFAPRDLKEFSGAVRVDGYPVSTVDHLELVRTYVELHSELRATHTLMTQAYAPLGIQVPTLAPTFLFEAERLAQRVDRVHEWWTREYSRLSERLRAIAVNPDPIARPDAVDTLIADLADASVRFEERQVAAELEGLVSRLREQHSAPDASPLWSRLLSAVLTGRPDEWSETLAEAQRLNALGVQVLQARAFLARIEQGGAPRWARSIRESRGAPAIVGDPGNLPRVWERAKARAWLAELHAEADIASLMDRSHERARELHGAILDLASRSARVELKKNLKDRQRRALDTWLTAVRRVGKGTGKNAPRFQAAAREALPAAMGAVPIWIMPIYRVIENFDPSVSDLFDVVVVDESSQCDLLSLGVLALGKKSVVVGDDKQTTPEHVGRQTDRIAALQDQHLRDIPGAKLLTLDESLYSISGRAFPSTIALREHFRCVPEIIEFSNRYYSGAIRPLREIGVPQIGDPLKVVRVEGATSVLHGSSRVNHDEAKALADQIAACISDEAYAGLTFGVVTMMSGPQAQLIQDLIRDRIGDEEFERRRLRVGNPPLFQGDERNVMFVSMVAHDNSFAATNLRYSQWSNVAVSRAQDQLWIFHSMDPATLHPEDQRRAMIEYAQAFGRRTETPAIYDVVESSFERSVLRQLLDRGHDVVPHYRVGNYVIDLVVQVAPGERLAIECDGDSAHGPDEWAADVGRQRVLERLGWTFWRIRASQYYLNPDAALNPLWKRLQEMQNRAAEAEALLRRRQESAAEQKLLAAPEEVAAPGEVAAPEEGGPPVREASSENRLEVAMPSQDDPAPLAASPIEPEPIRPEPVRTDPVVNQPPVPRPSNDSPQAPDPAEVRDWARRNGWSIGTRGRIPQEVLTAYRAAQHRPRADATPPSAETAPSRPSSDPGWTNLETAWKRGTAYQLNRAGEVVDPTTGRTLARAIGAQRANEIRDRMEEVRPSGGRFKVDQNGTMVTLVLGEPTLVMRVARDEWFPEHWRPGASAPE